MTRVFGLAGWSGSGKTTLITKLLPVLVERGLAVSTIKHTHHDFSIDKPGKDSWRHREAGATEVLVAAPARWAMIREHRGAPPPSLGELLERMAPVDLVLVEGFRSGDHAKLEVHRAVLGQAPLWHNDPAILAVASDRPLEGLSVPCLPLDDAAVIADFVTANARALG